VSQKLTVVSDKLDGEGLLGLLKKADKTFECVRKNGYLTANAGQFRVDLVVSMGSLRDKQVITFSESDLVATEVPGLQWLLNCPKFEAALSGSDPHCFGMDPRSRHKEMSWA